MKNLCFQKQCKRRNLAADFHKRIQMQKKTKIILFSVGGLFALIIIPLILIFAWIYFDSPVFPSKYGMKTISVGEKQIYFKRKAIGFNYDYIILSPNNDYCANYDPETDIRFLEFNLRRIYYKIDKDVLNLFTSTSTQPKNFPVKVKILDGEELRKWTKLKQKHLNGKLELLEIPLDNELKCN